MDSGASERARPSRRRSGHELIRPARSVRTAREGNGPHKHKKTEDLLHPTRRNVMLKG